MEVDCINNFTIVIFKFVDFSAIWSQTPALTFAATLLF